MAKVEHTSDARVLIGIRCPAAHVHAREGTFPNTGTRC
ncbi:hypothetical protein J2X53_003815 [Pseudorhodobacter sp. 4114]|nr:hypothetical protein [Pseudorhodobacter sp. 4114]